MGITCRPTGKLRGVLKKIQNQVESEKKSYNVNHGKKKKQDK